MAYSYCYNSTETVMNPKLLLMTVMVIIVAFAQGDQTDTEDGNVKALDIPERNVQIMAILKCPALSGNAIATYYAGTSEKVHVTFNISRCGFGYVHYLTQAISAKEQGMLHFYPPIQDYRDDKVIFGQYKITTVNVTSNKRVTWTVCDSLDNACYLDAIDYKCSQTSAIVLGILFALTLIVFICFCIGYFRYPQTLKTFLPKHWKLAVSRRPVHEHKFRHEPNPFLGPFMGAPYEMQLAIPGRLPFLLVLGDPPYACM